MLRPSRVDLPPATAAACREVYDAAQCGDVDRLRGLLHAAGDSGATPLHALAGSAAAATDAAVARAGIAALVAAGADVNARAGNGSTPLHWAAGCGAAAAVAALLAAGADATIASYTWRCVRS